MQFASPRLLDLSLFGNAGHLRDAEACDRLSGFPWELGVGTQSLAAVFNKTNNLLSRRRLKGHCQQRLDRYRSPVHGVGLNFHCFTPSIAARAKARDPCRNFASCTVPSRPIRTCRITVPCCPLALAG